MGQCCLKGNGCSNCVARQVEVAQLQRFDECLDIACHGCNVVTVGGLFALAAAAQIGRNGINFFGQIGEERLPPAAGGEAAVE